jgi:carboxyl-terminal processing protease
MHKRSLVPLGAATAIALTLFAMPPDVALLAADTKPDAKALAAAETSRSLEWLANVFQSVQRHYVEVPNDSRLIEAAISGMLSALEGSSYIEPRYLHDLQGCTGPAGCGGGLGVELTIEDGLATIVSPIDDSPAAKAGLMAGDIIARIDDEPTQGLALHHVADELHGQANSLVKLTIVRPGQDKPIEFSLVREAIRVPPIRFRAGGDVGYLRIVQVNERTREQLQKAIAAIKAQIPPERLKGYILDLRNNPNGLLNETISVASAFLGSGEIV